MGIFRRTAKETAQPTRKPADTTGPSLQRAQGGDVVLEVRDLQVSFASEAGTVHAVRGINFDLKKGQTLGIVGESGSGKSVTSMTIMGLLDPNASVKGSVKYMGEELLGKTDKEMSAIRGKNIAMVFQDPLSALTPVFTIGDQIKEALVTHNPDMTEEEIRDRSVELLNLVGIPKAEDRLKSFPHEFSGGMRQRVVIAMAIANNPDVIIADEPTTALDVTIQAQVLEVLQKAQKETGAALIFITHDLGVIAGMADDIIVMYAGRVVEHATVEDIFYRPVMPYTMGLLGAIPRPDKAKADRLVPIPGSPVNLADLPQGCPFAPRCPLVTDICRTSEPPLMEVSGRDGQLVACHRSQEIMDRKLTYKDVYTVGKSIVSKFEGIPREDRAVVLDVQHLTKTFPLTKGGFLRRRVGSVHAVNDVTFDIHEGETVALVGESGSGKSTTLLEIMNLKKPEQGSITLFGKNMADKMTRQEKHELHESVQYVFQDPMSSLDPRLTIYDILSEPLKVLNWDKDRIKDRVTELMGLVELNPDQVDRFPTQFSGGQRQRIAIARALAVNPKLILLDEPVSALDVSIQAGIINLLEDLQNKLGVAYLFVAHNLSVIRHISTRVAVMYQGRIVESGETEEVFEHPQHPYTKALLSAVPIPDPRKERASHRLVLEGELPSNTEEIEGCAFAQRCQVKGALPEEEQKLCEGEAPALEHHDLEGSQKDHQVACLFPEADQEGRNPAE